MSDETTPPSRPFPWLPTLLALLWLPSGALWMANAPHSVGCILLSLAWKISFPLIILACATLAILEPHRTRGTRARCVTWSLLAAAYGLPFAVWFVLLCKKLSQGIPC